eukprot:TRINITY_DN19_c0_g2_i1.p1 TRINITY_DN19_c0_g2~~TRINITY_DN19_c0_g2_i1.p1  ORF type:complete len:535 (-),score=64.03 TRINITY_DN19_c0_g2_i1:339-1817(-)
MIHTDYLQEGDRFIFEVNNESQTFYIAKSKEKVKLGKKQYFSIDQLIGHKWGSIFEIDAEKGVLKQVERPSCYVDPWTISETDRSNMDLVPSEENQELTQEDILQMKESKIEGSKIVDALIAGSKTFEGKNEFSQQKYKTKKAKKYAAWGIVKKPTSWSIAETYFKNTPERVYNLRPDTLSMLLSAANVRSGGQLLVIDACCGVVSGAALERMGGEGILCLVQFGQGEQRSLHPGEAVNRFNFTDEQFKILRVINYKHLSQGYTDEGMTFDEPQPDDMELDETQGQQVDDESELQSIELNGTQQQTPICSRNIQSTSNANKTILPAQDDATRETNNTENPNGNIAGQQGGVREWTKKWPRASQQELKQLAEEGFDGVIISAPAVDSYHLVELLTPFMRSSSSIVIYSNFLESLTQCYGQMQESREFVGMLIQETWLREFQVLPQRTRPPMNMDGTGGYFLMATKVSFNSQLERKQSQSKKEQSKKQKLDKKR